MNYVKTSEDGQLRHNFIFQKYSGKCDGCISGMAVHKRFEFGDRRGYTLTQYGRSKTHHRFQMRAAH